jgi:ABC-type glycerol-3-phosphate transport system substrate-binding protein
VPQSIQGETITESVTYPKYLKTLQAWRSKGYEDVKTSYNLPLEDISSTISQLETDEDNLLFLSWKQKDTLHIDVFITDEGLYPLELTYISLTETIKPIKVRVDINDTLPYIEASRFELPTLWSQDKDIVKDRFGNDIVPPSFQVYDKQTYTLLDSVGLYDDPLLFYFKEGLNTISLELIDGYVALYNLKVSYLDELITYEAYRNSFNDQLSSTSINFEGESFSLKTDPSIRSTNHRDAKVTPFSLMTSTLNILDGNTFNKQNQAVYYTFEVLETGNYYLTLKVLQNGLINTNAYRHVSINGRIPFQEAKHIEIPYARDFQYMTLKKGDTPLLFHFTKGTHTLGLHVDMSSTQFVYDGILNMMSLMNETALDLQKITGNQIDADRDWDLKDYMPNLENDLNMFTVQIKSLYDHWVSFHGDGASPITSSLKLSYERMDKLSKEPNELPKELYTFSIGSGSILALLGNILPLITQSPLSIDHIHIHNDFDQLPPLRANIFIRIWIGIQRFFLSFFSAQYDDTTSDDELDVWVNRSRAYVDLMQQMADSLYTTKTGQKVRISLMPDENKLILANAAGAHPDVAMGIAAWRPFEFAVRGALYDLRNFDTFNDVSSRFAPGSFLSLIYDEGVYALPETQNFQLLFYRKDVLNQLNLEVPNTWYDVIEMLPELQRFGMNFYIPLANNSSFKSFDTTFPFIAQFGGSLYAEDGLSVSYDNPKTMQALSLMTDFFKVYALPVEVGSFYQRFRYGNLPIGIGDFSMYVQLLNAAPEIAGLWDIAMIPGIESDGEINRSFVGASTVNIIFDATDKKDEAWEFLSWWSSNETQITYAERLLTTYGSAFLWNTANLEAFLGMSFDTNHQQVIYNQWAYVYDTVKIPGSYMVERELSNIWNKVVYDGVQIRTAIEDGSVTANREITRKMIEFGYLNTSGIPVRPYFIPDLNTMSSWGVAYDD